VCLAEAQRYKPEGCGFDYRCVIGIFHFYNPSGRTMALGSTRNNSCGVKAAGAYG